MKFLQAVNNSLAILTAFEPIYTAQELEDMRRERKLRRFVKKYKKHIVRECFTCDRHYYVFNFDGKEVELDVPWVY